MAFGNRARGTMVSRQERVMPRRDRLIIYPVIEFVAASGDAVTFTDIVPARKWAIGRGCAVAYAPADPAGTAVVVRPNAIVGLLICTVFSLTAFASAVWLLSGGAESYLK
jgi:hypothetical protein